MEFTFNLSFRLPNDEVAIDLHVERLGEEGCDDALVGLGQPGRIALEFTREAESALAAFLSALADVKRAIPRATLIEAGPDLVGLTDIADLVGVSRQNMRKLAITNYVNVPTPVHEGSSTIWHLADVLKWLHSRGTYRIDVGILETASSAKQLNLARQVRHADPEVLRCANTWLA